MQINSLRDIVVNGASEYGTIEAVRYLKKGEIISKTYAQLKEDTEAVSNMIAKFKLEEEHIAIIGTSSYEWIVSYLGIVNSNSVAVPLDAALPAKDLWVLLNRAHVSALIYDKAGVEVAKGIEENCPNVKYTIRMEEEAEEENSLHKLMERYKAPYDKKVDPYKLCTIMFTSGTTGISKGVMLSQHNLVSNVQAVHIDMLPGTVSLSVLPIHHAFCLTMDFLKGFSIGITVCINDSLLHMVKNIKRFEPQIMLMVPLMIETIYKKLQDNKLPVPKKVIAKKVFGGRLEVLYSGGAYLAPQYVEAFSEYGIPILQGYGMTECSPVIARNDENNNKVGSVGKALENCEVKIEDGEILARGSSVMLGYYEMEKETSETIDEDGWLHTGDLGYVDEDGYLFITGRKKNLIILSNGENISPEEIESELLNNREIAEVIVRGKGNLIEAEIFPDFEYLKKKKMKDERKRLQEIIDDYNDGVPRSKRIASFIIRDTEFEKNTTKKIKRGQYTMS